MLLGKSHFQHGFDHEFRFISEGTIRPLLLKQMVQRPSYPSGMLVIPVFGQQAKRPSGAPRPTPVQALQVQKRAYLHRLEAR